MALGGESCDNGSFDSPQSLLEAVHLMEIAWLVLSRGRA